MKELVELVLSNNRIAERCVRETHDGSLKAEHGTGINMAPFLVDEWGEKATDMMWRIKSEELTRPEQCVEITRSLTTKTY